MKRVGFILDHIQPNGLLKDMMDKVHIDVEWYYMTKVKKSYYLLPEEDVPIRTISSRRFITKVMFLVAMARP